MALKLFVFSLLISLQTFAAQCPYPADWWKPVPPAEAKSWEVLPQEAACEDNTVILSKRNELGIFSNYGATPFTFRGVKYASLEGFWQAMKYPENAKDPRHNPELQWAYTREQVQTMTAEEAKKAGDLGNANMKKLGITWITFEGERIEYKGKDQPRHYEIIEAATKAKLDQNQNVRILLKKTGNLILKPDHKSESQELPSYRYYDIFMKLRKNL